MSPSKGNDDANGNRDQMAAYRQWLVEAQHKAYEAYDKAVMTLAGGALAISLTFVKDVVSSPRQGTVTLLALAWGSLALSIMMILVSIMTGAYSLRRAVKQVDEGTVYTQPVGGRFSTLTTVLNVAAAVTFVAGIAFLALFAIGNMSVVGKKLP